MIDSWYYASCVKYGKELFNSHHLIYNIIGFYWFSLLRLFNPSIEGIFALNFMNAIAATACLFVLYKCLYILKTDKGISFWLTLFCGVSFGFMRYATDAETYILPLLFSLLSTYFLISHKQKLLLSGLFAAIAVLVHQLHIWWAVAIFIFLLLQKPLKTKELLIFSCSFILIPVTYYFAFSQIGKNTLTFIQFITGEYSKGNASVNISLSSLILTLINFIRTFLQIHGQIISLFKEYGLPYFIVAGSCMAAIAIILFKTKFKIHRIGKNDTVNYSNLFLIAFILQFLFAFISSGNAEFMVMLPFLLVLFLASKYQFLNIGSLKYIVILMFVWNFSFAIFPNACLDINKVNNQVKIMRDNPDAFFLWKNKPLVENVLTYRTGFTQPHNFIDNKYMDKRLLDKLLADKKVIFTDVPNSNGGISREWFLADIGIHKILKQYHLQPIDSFKNLYGKNYIYIIQ